MKRCLSILMPLSLIVAMIVIWFLKVARGFPSMPHEFVSMTCFCAIYLAWLIFELRVSLREEKRSYADFGTRELYGVSHAATILTALWYGEWTSRVDVYHGIGFFLFLSGVAFRISAITALGRFYSHAVGIAQEHKIICSGPYRLVRHPSYAGMLLAHVGVLVFFQSIVAVIVYFFALLPAIVVRIRVEERALMAIPGYADYAGSRRRIFPGIW